MGPGAPAALAEPTAAVNLSARLPSCACGSPWARGTKMAQAPASTPGCHPACKSDWRVWHSSPDAHAEQRRGVEHPRTSNVLWGHPGHQRSAGNAQGRRSEGASLTAAEPGSALSGATGADHVPKSQLGRAAFPAGLNQSCVCCALPAQQQQLPNCRRTPNASISAAV